ncbi:MAG: hypothetical protein JKY34_00625 [Kordiimonadaceae bacterium]|nr:hypothetical protein [Kordiimonadaceae bacterium]
MNRLTLYLSNGKAHVWIGIGGALALNGTVRQGNVRVDLVRLMLYSNGAPKVKTLWELSNVPLIIISGLSYMGIGRRLELAPNDLSFIEAPDHFTAFKLLKKGRAKYLLNYEVTSQLGVKSMESADLRAMVVQKIPLYFLVSNALENAGELLAKLDQALLDIRKEDSYSIADKCDVKIKPNKE